ncbi:RagB/SusD family nutrient uptake outer membrane protein [Aurantibacter crassamenti]|uniref:RagB/SusD family nutrient uptake outer membrane protein n=1 Tax=Aurantibacter crassamenti TaxID=1837375 RepID=UPI001939DD03|nr:RagB/SusD family nutrient uptake outer membrane protein [Aurantibacter crassamenti]MBM1105876.1 RagB/SusD family nutrient uptake outer membrane protein [Aurantibacter crassamenti]
MKNIKKLNKLITPLLSLLVVLMASCDLDESPKDRVSGEEVFQSEGFADALAGDLYAQFPYTGFDDFDGKLGHNDLGTERVDLSACLTHGGMTNTADCEGFWDYEFIRDMNVFLENLAGSELSATYKGRLEGEIRAMRAAVYFKMQKRYGGVPLVDVVLDPFEEVPNEYRVRSTEEAIADFIDSELAAAAVLMAANGDNTDQTGRFNQYTALAYKARANLHAASIAKFGVLNANSLTGIPAGRANEFYTKASAAAQAVIAGPYSLLTGGDPVQTYRNIFIEDSNSEIIFERIYNGNQIGHSFAHQNQPTPFSEGQGSELNPTLGLVNYYENLDGTFTSPVLGEGNLYATGRGPWEDKDPRLHASVLFEGDIYAGNIVELYEGIDNGTEIISEVGVLVGDKQSVGSASRRQENQFWPSTGFLLHKYVSPTPVIPAGLDSNNWKELRLGEMYLIAAESEFEKDASDAAAAAEWLNYTRNRAGLMNIEDTPGGITRERIRIERTSELIYEGHRWFDTRRWRIAADVLDGQTVQGVRVIYDDPSGQYYFLVIDTESSQRQFRPEHYYNPITLGRIEAQSELVENPGY